MLNGLRSTERKKWKPEKKKIKNTRPLTKIKKRFTHPEFQALPISSVYPTTPASLSNTCLLE